MKDMLISQLDRFRNTLEAEPLFWGKRDWLRSVELTSAELVEGLRDHARATEEPGGTLATLQSSQRETVPTLQRRVVKLRHDHVSLMDEAESCLLHVREALRSQHVRRDAALIGTEGAQLADDLEQHLHIETNLYLDSLNTVVGVGD